MSSVRSLPVVLSGHSVRSRYNSPQATDSVVSLRVGKSDEGECRVTPEDLFGRHCAVVGTTGSGKSWTLARLIEEAARFDSKVILFDASGEYNTLGAGVRHVRVGGTSEGNVERVAIPYYHLRETDLFAIFKPTGPSQSPKLRQAMKSLKLARLASHLAPDGKILKAHRSKVQVEQEMQRFQADLDSPYALFDIFELPQQIQNECVDFQRSALEPLVWGGVSSQDLSFCIPLVNRIQDIISNPSFAVLFQPQGYRSLFEVLRDFFSSSEDRVLRVCLKDLPFEHHTREVVVNAIGLHLLGHARQGAFRRTPLLLVLDEAHQFISKGIIAEESEDNPLDSFGLIAKEGRKYALNLCLATQRPRDIPEDVLSQVGSMIVHRLINPADRAVVQNACGEMDTSVIAALPGLSSGSAFILGAGFSEAVSLKIHAPTAAPDSRGPDYQGSWGRSLREV